MSNLGIRFGKLKSVNKGQGLPDGHFRKLGDVLTSNGYRQDFRLQPFASAVRALSCHHVLVHLFLEVVRGAFPVSSLYIVQCPFKGSVIFGFCPRGTAYIVEFQISVPGAVVKLLSESLRQVFKRYIRIHAVFCYKSVHYLAIIAAELHSAENGLKSPLTYTQVFIYEF